MDDGSPIRYLVYIFLFILGGAYFASAEMSLASVNRIRMMTYADGDDKRAKRVLFILNRFDQALATILIGSNLMQTCCAALATLLVTKLWGVGALAYSTVIVTVVLSFFGELIPKRYAKDCNERMALGVSASMLLLMRVMAPISFVFRKFNAIISKPFERATAEPTVTEDELYDIIESIVEEGELEREEGELAQNALDFSYTTAREVCTPWSRTVKLSVGMHSDQILQTIQDSIHSRFPVIGAGGNIVGVLQMRNYLKAYIIDRSVTLSQVMDDARFVQGELPIDDLLAVMSNNQTHMAIVLDGEGNTLGIVTMEDILEELVGEIYDEDDTEGGNRS